MYIFSAQKLIDAWQNTGPSSLRLPDRKKAIKLPREMCESILAHLLLEGYLKEDFHFTPYSTISYLVLGTNLFVVFHLYLSIPVLLYFIAERAVGANKEIMMMVEASSEASAEGKPTKGKAIRKQQVTTALSNSRSKKPKVEECLIEVSDSD